ncbi:uncharacterized protein LOC127281967 [Leptopilina boulardi]|uniref:uncharacterized protein LOC127281967 n=1 Tax=Leptopilina boulardi TaxID=63433 RepID=UPI0021F59976|nr:uncharacterized protein LOC127281967 [Leptopilina boulardi]XP_051161952.1 uncharacterized protein LOC127281967 [Leptopilina boulardi]
MVQFSRKNRESVSEQEVKQIEYSRALFKILSSMAFGVMYFKDKDEYKKGRGFTGFFILIFYPGWLVVSRTSKTRAKVKKDIEFFTFRLFRSRSILTVIFHILQMEI